MEKYLELSFFGSQERVICFFLIREERHRLDATSQVVPKFIKIFGAGKTTRHAYHGDRPGGIEDFGDSVHSDSRSRGGRLAG